LASGSAAPGVHPGANPAGIREPSLSGFWNRRGRITDAGSGMRAIAGKLPVAVPSILDPAISGNFGRRFAASIGDGNHAHGVE